MPSVRKFYFEYQEMDIALAHLQRPITQCQVDKAFNAQSVSPLTLGLGKKTGSIPFLWKQALLPTLGSQEYKWFSPDRVAAALPACQEQIKSLSQQCQNCVPRSVVWNTGGRWGGELMSSSLSGCPFSGFSNCSRGECLGHAGCSFDDLCFARYKRLLSKFCEPL